MIVAVGDIKKNPLVTLSESGMLLDEDGHVAPLRAIVGIDVESGQPVVVAVKGGKLTISGEGLATQETLAAMLVKLSGPGEDVARSGQKTVAVSGTAEAVGSDVDTKALIIIADLDNGGNIYVGSATVDNSNGAKLPPGGILPCGAVNLSEIYIDADIDEEGISYYYTV